MRYMLHAGRAENCCTECKLSPCDPCDDGPPCPEPMLYTQSRATTLTKCGARGFAKYIGNDQFEHYTSQSQEGCDAPIAYLGPIPAETYFLHEERQVRTCDDEDHCLTSSIADFAFDLTNNDPVYGDHCRSSIVYDPDPPCNAGYAPAVSGTVSNEYTDEMLQTNAQALVGGIAYPAQDPKDAPDSYGTGVAHLSMDGVNFSLRKFRYQIGVTMPPSGSYTATWKEVATRDEDATVLSETPRAWEASGSGDIYSPVYAVDTFPPVARGGQVSISITDFRWTCVPGATPTGEGVP